MWFQSEIWDETQPVWAWALFRYKDSLSRYGEIHYKDKTGVKPSCICNVNLYTDKTTSLYWKDPLDEVHSPNHE